MRINTLTNGQKYYIAVDAVNEAGMRRAARAVELKWRKHR